MEVAAPEDCHTARRFNPLRSVRRGLKAACCWTARFGRGISASASGKRAGRRTGRGRAPPLASFSTAMLEPGSILHLGDEQNATFASDHQESPMVLALSPLHLQLTTETSGDGSSFPLAIRPPQYSAADLPTVHAHFRRSLHYEMRAEDDDSRDHHRHQLQHLLPSSDLPWTRLHAKSSVSHRCACDGDASGALCTEQCLAAEGEHLRSHSSDSPLVYSTVTKATVACSQGNVGLQEQQARSRVLPPEERDHSLQHLLAVGSRQWGGGSWWDGRSLFHVRIYDFAIYTDPARATQALRSAAVSRSPFSSSTPEYRNSPKRSCSRGGEEMALGNGGGCCPAELLVSPSSRVDMSLTIRACRNLPLHLLSAEFERVLERRHMKAGGRPDDPDFRELLSYFSRERLPEDLVVTSPPSSSSSSVVDAVRKGASITFSRSACGSLVTEAGGRVLGRVQSPALVEALFDMYLGDQPVSKRAKVAAGEALLQMAATEQCPDQTGYRYRPQPGERLECRPVAKGAQDVEACVLRLQ